MELQEKPVSAKLIKDLYTGATQIRKFLLQLFDEHIDQLAKLTQEYAAGTVKNYRVTRKHVSHFLQTKKLKDVPIDSIDYKFIADFDFFIMTKLGENNKRSMNRNSANKQHQRLKTILLKAVRQDLLEKSPYLNFKLKNKPTNREYLTDEELALLKSHDFAGNASLQRVHDIFFFSVYTGLRFDDAKGLQPQHLVRDKDEQVWIKRVTGKTNKPVRIPLLTPATEILQKYELSVRKVTGYLLPQISNQKLNVYLKIVADLAGINKHLTHHVARHTFATIALEHDFPLEVVSELLAHKDLRTTLIYAKTKDKTISRLMAQLDGKF